MHLPTFSYWLPLSIILLLNLYSTCISQETRDSANTSAFTGNFNISIRYCPKTPDSNSIQGIVFDEKNGHPLKGATLQIDDPRITVPADSNGYFSFNNLPITSIDLFVSMVGYPTLCITDIDISPDSIAVIFVFLNPEIYPLRPDIMVRGERKGIDFLPHSVVRIHTRPRVTWNDPKISVDIDPAVPFINVVPISVISSVLGEYPLLEETYIYYYIQAVSRDKTIDLSKDALHFYYTIPGGKGERARIVDPSLSVFDQFDKRMIEREAVKPTDRERLLNAHRQKIKNSRP